MELERADVGTLVLLLFVQTLLELTLLLEAVLLGHLALLLVGLDGTAFSTEYLHLAVEQLVFAELTFQTAVEEGNLDAGLQTDLVEALLTIRENPGIVVGKLVLQSFTDHLVRTQQVGRRDTLTVGRISHHDALLLGLREELEVLFSDGDVVGQTGGLDVQTGCIDGLDVDVVAIDVMLELAFLRVVIVYLVEEVGIEVGPLLEGKLLAEQSRGHIAGNQGGLDEQRTTAAHGVDEVAVALPARHQDHAGSQHLVERCFHRLLTVAATVQRLATGVETQGTLALAGGHVGNMDMQTHVWIGNADIGTLASLLAELVDNGILHLVSHKLRVSEFLREYHRVDGKRLVEGEIVRPVHRLHTFVDIVSRQCLEALDGFQNTDGSVQLEIGTVHKRFIASEGHHASSFLHIVCAQLRQFFRQDRFQSHKGLGDHFKFLCHDVIQ